MARFSEWRRLLGRIHTAWLAVAGLLLATPLAGVAAEGPSSGGVDAGALAASVEIYRDAWGVPHIVGPTDEAVVFGFAYCQAEDYFWQLEDSFIMGLGRHAEVSGSKGLKTDLLCHAFQIPQRSKADYEDLPAETKSICEAFAAGLNYYLAKHPETKPRMITHFEPWHLLAVSRGVIIAWGAMGMGHTGASPELPIEFSRTEAAVSVYDRLDAAVGSNAWAVSGEKTKSGNAMLFINPHQPYYGFGQFYEGHLISGEGWNFTGATFFGSPVPTLGHNEYCGWSFTVNRPNTSDSWIEVFDDPDNPLNYRYGDGYKTAEEWQATIKVKRGRRMKSNTYTFRKTHRGPVIKKLDDERYISVRIGKLYEAFLAPQNMEMVRSKNLDDFRRAMSMQNLAIFNTAYADRDGNIMYFYNGIVPKRNLGYDYTKPLDGTDPKTDWIGGYHPFEELPRIVNPSTGYIQTCNASPFTTTDVGNPFKGDFPEYMVLDKNVDNGRAKVSRMILRDLENVTFDRWQELAFDTRSYWAMTQLPRYERAYQRLKESNAELAGRVKPYLEHLLEWDYVCRPDDTYTQLCQAWHEELYGFGYPADKLKEKYILEPELRFQALIDAANKLEETFGDWKVAWGEVNRIQRHANVADFYEIPFSDELPSLPAAGLQGTLGVVFNMYFTPSVNLPPLRVHKKHYAVVGHSYVSTVEFGDRVQGGSLLQYGESGDPESPHFFDQAKLLSEKKFKPQWFYLEDVVENAKRKYHPGEEVGQVATTQAGG